MLYEDTFNHKAMTNYHTSSVTWEKHRQPPHWSLHSSGVRAKLVSLMYLWADVDNLDSHLGNLQACQGEVH